MKSIIRRHEKVLDQLIEFRKDDPTFFFMPRKINNKNRLDLGYWFIGNDWYLNLSFWNGTDWKEKIHNIGFVVLENKNSYIELSAQDSDLKAEFLTTVAKKIGGFKKAPSKNKWFWKFEGKDYLSHLKFFIENIKPKIDELISQKKPIGIMPLTKANHKKYSEKIIKRRQIQIEFGKKNKISRICWNSENWRRPSGSAGKSNAVGSFENINGFGHEEWLFDRSKIIKGYHYGFLEPLRLKSKIHVEKKYDITLYTINNNSKRYYVGKLKNVICIDGHESEKIFNEYLKLGFIEQMKKQIDFVGGKTKSLTSFGPNKFFNIKFEFENVELADELIEISSDDNNITADRFKLLPQKNRIIFESVIEIDDLSEGKKKNTKRRKRIFNSESEYDPYHDMMQNSLKEFLDKTGNYKIVQIEKDRVDLKGVTHENKWHYYELKTDNPKLSIRKAIGQIMEYSYYPNIKKAEKLFIISDRIPNEETIKYLNFIRENFRLPVVYQAFDLNKMKLSKEY